MEVKWNRLLIYCYAMAYDYWPEVDWTVDMYLWEQL